MVDFHSHILPGVDHGSKSLEVSLAQLELASKYGVKKIIATSHFYPHKHTVESFLNVRSKAFSELQKNVLPHHPEIRLAAEVLMCEGIERLEGLRQLCLEGTDFLFLEIPYNDFSGSLIDSVRQIHKKGIAKVILVHPERYSPKIIEDFLNVGAELQINADVLNKFFIPRCVKSWLKQGKIVAIGSDIHGANANAYRKFSVAIKKLGRFKSYVRNASESIWNSAKL